MNDSSLWPSLDDILQSNQNAPLEFLRTQGENIKSISEDLDYVILQEECNSATPLSMHTIYLNTSTINLGLFNNQIDASFQICRQGAIYKGEILRMRYSLTADYPVEIYDCCNQQYYSIESISDLTSCIKQIFNTNNCMRLIRYVLCGPTA